MLLFWCWCCVSIVLVWLDTRYQTIGDSKNSGGKGIHLDTIHIQKFGCCWLLHACLFVARCFVVCSLRVAVVLLLQILLAGGAR